MFRKRQSKYLLNCGQEIASKGTNKKEIEIDLSLRMRLKLI